MGVPTVLCSFYANYWWFLVLVGIVSHELFHLLLSYYRCCSCWLSRFRKFYGNVFHTKAFLPICLCSFKTFISWKLNSKVQNVDITKITRPMWESLRINRCRIWCYCPRHRTILHSDQRPSTTVCMYITPNLLCQQIEKCLVALHEKR